MIFFNYPKKHKQYPVNIKKIKKNFTLNLKTKITNQIHKKFMKFSEDNSKIHVDNNFAKRNGFRGKIGYSFMLLSFLSKIFGTIFPGGNELCLSESFNFKNPFYINDILTFKIKILQISIDNELLRLSIDVFNQKNTVIMSGQTTLLLKLK